MLLVEWTHDHHVPDKKYTIKLSLKGTKNVRISNEEAKAVAI